MLSRKIISIWFKPRNPLIHRCSILSSKPYMLNGLFTKSFFTSKQLLLASKKKASRKESGKKGKSYASEDLVEEEENNTRNLNFDLNKIETKLNVVIEKLKKEYSSMRIGHANPGLKKFLFFLLIYSNN